MKRLLTVAAVLVLLAAGCGDDDDSDDAAATTTTKPKVTAVDLTARDYAFDVADSIPGGVVEFDFRNGGKEPHFAGLLKLPGDKTIDDVRAFFAGPPAGPPPFEEIGGLPAADPGGSGNVTLELDAGNYAFFCAIPAPDGQPHFAKGMIEGLTVTSGAAGELPDAEATITARDFAYGPLPELAAGETVVAFDNQGTQFHEINLVELPPGKTIDDLTAFLDAPAGPPPARFLAGAAIKPKATSTTRLTLKAGSTYAFFCAIPDPADGKPHYAKGMKSPSFTT